MTERVLVVLLLFAFTGAHTTLLFGAAPEVGGFQASPDLNLIRLSWLPLYVPLVLLLLRDWRHITATALGNPWLVLLIILCPLSIVWSTAPEETLRRSFAILITAGFGFYLAARFNQRTLLILLCWALSAALFLSLITGLLLPDVGFMQVENPGALRGVLSHKNDLGRFAALNVIVVTALLARDERRLPLGVALIASLATLIMSQSRLPLIALLIAAFVAIAVFTARARNSVSAIFGLSALIAVALSVVLASLYYQDFLAALGRDTSLTGRTEFWPEVWASILERPVLGYGYGAFWTEDSQPAHELMRFAGWAIPNAHNGYLDLALQLGFTGLMLLFLSLAGGAMALIARLRHEEASSVYWIAMFLAFLVVQEFGETGILRQHHLTTVLFVTVATTLASMRRRSIGHEPPNLSGQDRIDVPRGHLSAE